MTSSARLTTKEPVAPISEPAFGTRIFLPFAAGYFLSQLLRSVNAVVSADLIAELSLDAWTVGLLTSAYFLAFALAQLPVGLSLDRLGPRRTESFLLLFAAAGAIVFALGSGPDALIAGRALIGFGVSACLMASFHAFALWAPPARLPFLSGAVMSVGAAGALAATSPVEWAVARIGWRMLFVILSGLAFATTAFLYLASRDAPESREHESVRESVVGLFSVFRSRAFWSVAPFSVAHQGSYLAIQSLWAGPWLSDVAGLQRTEVASQLSVLALGMALGFTGLGYVAGQWKARGGSPVTVWVAAAIVFQTAQLGIALGLVRHATLLWATFGIFGASGMLSYGVLTTRFPLQMAGRVNTALNVFVFTGAFALQAGIGAIITWLAPEGRAYSDLGYRVAFLSALGLQAAALAWLLLTSRWRRAPVVSSQ